jgi:hypothetical protein
MGLFSLHSKKPCGAAENRTGTYAYVRTINFMYYKHVQYIKMCRKDMLFQLYCALYVPLRLGMTIYLFSDLVLFLSLYSL